ncbi:MAG: alpha/beta fold hydrolase, partial [Pyrinomonadaceae bacterium]
TEENTAEREFYSFDVRNNDKAKVFTNEKGMKSSPQLDKSNGQPTLLYEFSKWNQPTELFTTKVCTRCRGLNYPEQITKSTPENFKKIKWNEPKFIDIPSRDGKQIKSKIYLPSNFDKSKKYPMVIFVHGAGYLQNTINGWNNYYREFMFNELLTQKGYVILDIDYRGSAGYGRDWRTDVYDFLGGKDYEDHLDAIDFMTTNYAVDAKKIGVYGGSYGGFMAEMLVMRAPEKIAAAAALRPVADWKNYFYSSPGYTVERLGFPDKNAEAYKRSSPITYADKLQKPLLILHGLVDDNVPAQDSMQLVEKLIRLEKTPYFEAMFYPSESHGFTRPTSWTDEYGRILTFFEKHLKN